MKAPLLLVLGTLFAAHAHAAPRTTHASFAQMKKDVQDYSPVLQSIDGCNFEFKETPVGMELVMKDEKKGTAVLEVSASSLILLESGDQMEDGSFSKSYKVQGQGELDFVHAEDAYDHAFLTDRNGNTLSCEIDY
jgi:hypothetical protein